MRDKKNDPGTDEQGAEDGRKNEAEAARFCRELVRVMALEGFSGFGGQNSGRDQLRKLGAKPPNSRAVRRTHSSYSISRYAERKANWRRLLPQLRDRREGDGKEV